MWKESLFSPPCCCRQWCVSSWLCFSFVRDAIPSCNAEEFVKEASEVPNFMEEVDKCRKICSTDTTELSGEFSSLNSRGMHLVLKPNKMFLTFKWMVLQWCEKVYHRVSSGYISYCRERRKLPRGGFLGNRISPSNEDQKRQRHFSQYQVWSSGFHTNPQVDCKEIILILLLICI